MKFYREVGKLSQGQLYKKVDISIKHFSAIERGLAFVSDDLLEKLPASLRSSFLFFVNDEK